MRSLNEDKDDFNKWLAAWDKASEQIAKEFAEEQKNPKPQPELSFSSEDKDDSDPSWHDIYMRAQQINTITDNSELLSEIDWDRGEKGGEVRWGGRPPTKSNPISYASVGQDQSPRPYKPLRVSDNWADGDDLRELDEIKRRVEQLERKHHTAEVKDKESDGLKKELEGLRTRIEELSEKINCEPEVDVT